MMAALISAPTAVKASPVETVLNAEEGSSRPNKTLHGAVSTSAKMPESDHHR